MHERTQRAIARMTFVFCCAVPTLVTCVIIAVTWTPWWHRRSLAAIEASLSRDTGLVLQIADFKRAAPSTLCLYGVEIFEPETGHEVARVREIQWVQRGQEVSILLQQPELQSSELAHTWKMIHDRFVCRPEQTSSAVQLAANDLTIHSRTGPLTLRDVDAWIRPRVGENAVEATIQCLPATTHLAAMIQSPSPVNITVVRDRGGDAPSTSWTLSTGETALPCSALAEYLPQLERLGSDAMFSGSMRWSLRPNGWTIDLGGSRFTDIALGQWLENLPHRLTGTATIQLERCRVVCEQRVTNVVDIAGSLRARDGLVGPSMFASARRHLGFAVADVDSVVAYDRIALGFNLNGPLLHLEGVCRTEVGYEGLHSGVVLCAGGHPLAESSGETLQATQLQAAFAPGHSVMVPLSRQTSPLMDILMPPSRPAPSPLAPSSDSSIPRITSTRPLRESPSIAQP